MLQSFRGLCCRAKAVGMSVAYSGVCTLSHMQLRRAEILHALQEQQSPDIDFSTEELVSTRQRVSYSELVQLEQAAGLTAHHAATVPCICATCPPDHPEYGEYW